MWIACKALDGQTEVLINTQYVQSVVCSGPVVFTFSNGMRESVHGDNWKAIVGKLSATDKVIAKRKPRR